MSVDWGAHVVVATGHRLALLVALSTSRRSPRRAATSTSEAPPLSPRELEIVELVALGYSGPEIAQQLHISHETVRTHVRNAMVKTARGPARTWSPRRSLTARSPSEITRP